MEDYDLAIMIIRCLMKQDEELDRQSKLLAELEEGFAELLAPYKDQIEVWEREERRTFAEGQNLQEKDAEKPIWPEPGD